jgi:signal transduction histidine kinase
MSPFFSLLFLPVSFGRYKENNIANISHDIININLAHKKYQLLVHRVTRLLHMPTVKKACASRSAVPSPRKSPKRAKPGAQPNGKHAPDGQHPLVLERRRSKKLWGDGAGHLREVEALAQNLIQAGERQQQTISRELHDNIAQVLAAASNRITLAKDEKIPAWLRQELLDLRDQLEGALQDVRTLARDLRPALLDHFGFAAALEKQADGFRQRSGITLDIRLEPDAVNFLHYENLTHLFRLAQEALQNIEEHSAATRAWFTLLQQDGTLHLEIGDNGRAFTPERVAEAQDDGHLGLLGIRERAELLGGLLLLEAVPGQGTTIHVEIPVLPPPPRARTGQT